jgi:hypothetical protein
VLDKSGVRQDAYDVAIAGDDDQASDAATRETFAQFIGDDAASDAFTAEELRYAMLAIASGIPLEALRWKISASLFAVLAAHLDRLSEPALSALREHFELDEDEIIEEEELSAVHGASLVHFPKRIRKRRLPDLQAPGYAPISSSRIA